MNTRTNKQEQYREVFDFLMDWAIHENRLPKYVAEAVDVVANYVGDKSSPRRLKSRAQ